MNIEITLSNKSHLLLTDGYPYKLYQRHSMNDTNRIKDIYVYPESHHPFYHASIDYNYIS